MGTTEAISRDNLKELCRFSPEVNLVVSVYLDVDGEKYPRRQDYEKALRGLLNQAAQDWVNGDHLERKEIRQGVQRDLDTINRFVEGNWERDGSKGLAIFSCAEQGFWQVYELPISVPSALIVGPEPYAKTLTTLLSKYKRFCVVSVDRKKSRFFTVHLGALEAERRMSIDESVPDQVKEGDWANLRQSKIARHIDDHIMHHLKGTAAEALEFFMKHECDHLIVSGQKDILPRFKQLLHPYLAERLVGEFALNPSAPERDFLEHSLEVEQDVRRGLEKKLVRQLKKEAAAGGHGVTGLNDTLQALMRGQVHTLVLAYAYTQEGHVCYTDHYLDSRAGACPVCGAELTKADDIVEDMVQLAVNQNVAVEYISEESPFAQKERVGALLRYGQRRAVG